MILTAIQNQYLGAGNKILKEDMIANILDITPEEYHAVLTE
jgi:hypothetical protein